MNNKKIELKRITKTATLLILSGISKNSIPNTIIERCLKEQHDDGGWASVVDTMWNITFLKILGSELYKREIYKGLNFLGTQKNNEGLWGRSQRDISRIPVSGAMLYLLPELVDNRILHSLEKLWLSEKNSLTYKAAYTLMAFKRNNYVPSDDRIIEETVNWLVNNQRDDGGFSPWRDHPVQSDVFCTSIATLGLLQYKELVSTQVLEGSFRWLTRNQLPNGIWKFHEIEDGASWGLYAIVKLLKNGVIENG